MEIVTEIVTESHGEWQRYDRSAGMELPTVWGNVRCIGTCDRRNMWRSMWWSMVVWERQFQRVSPDSWAFVSRILHTGQCYVLYHRSNSVSVSAQDALQTHSWSSNITSHMLPFSIWTISVPVWVLQHPTISEITITLSFGTSLVNGLRPTHASLFGISDYGYARSRYHMIQFTSPHVYSFHHMLVSYYHAVLYIWYSFFHVLVAILQTFMFQLILFKHRVLVLS